MDDYKTDKWLAELFLKWDDPCPYRGLEEKKDGLIGDWKNNSFINPPYSNPLPWVRKAILENAQWGSTMVLLLKVDTSTQWYKELHEAGAHFLWINGRLKHQTEKPCPFPSMLAILESHDKTQVRFPQY